MYCRKLSLSLLMFFWGLGHSSLMACHEGDFGALNKGHHKWGKSAGIFQYTENITIITFSSTSCDLYTAYLETQIDIIQEQVAQGNGPQLDALAHYSGCEKQVLPSFRQTMFANYEKLFGSTHDAEILRKQIIGLIETTPSLRRDCQIERIPELLKAKS